MKRKLWFCLLLAFFFIGTKNIFGNEKAIKLYIENEEIKNLPTAPVIFNDCVVVPVREILEKLEAKLEWRENAKELLIFKDNTCVLFTVNETVAKVNGQEKILAIPAVIINNKLMIPVRFIGETFGFDVEWVDNLQDRKVMLIKKNKPEIVDEKKNDEEKYLAEESICKLISVRKKNNFDDKYLIETDGKINFSGKIDFVKEIFLSGNRLAIDIKNCEVDSDFKLNGDDFKNELLRNIRFSQYKLEPDKIVRIVFDLEDGVDYSISKLNGIIEIELKKIKCNCKNIECDENIIKLKKENGFINIDKINQTDLYDEKKYVFRFDCDLEDKYGNGKFFIRNDYFSSLEIKNQEIIVYENKIFAYDIYEDAKNIYIKAVNPKEKYENILVIDAGHGGNDSGTRNNDVNEKDLTLDIVQKILSLFENDFDRSRIKVYATRLSDKKVSLSKRVEIANDIGDLFISVHINSSPNNPDANGTEVFYCKRNNSKSKNNFSSSDLANILLSNLIEELNSTNRNVKSNDFYVIKNTKIPAALCEIGFITNQNEFDKLCNENYRLKAARAIYNSVKYLLEN